MQVLILVLPPPKFIISPFVDIFERQIIISMVGYSLFFISIFYFDYFRSFIERLHLYQKKLVFIGIIFVVSGYVSSSAAMGSEIMKIFIKIVLFSEATKSVTKQVFYIVFTTICQCLSHGSYQIYALHWLCSW